MSRALNVAADEAELLTLCAKLGVNISAIEPLASGGTRIVLKNSPDAEKMRAKLGNRLIKGTVQRSASYVGRQPANYS